MQTLITYLVIAFLTTVLLLIYLIRSFRKRSKLGTYLGSVFASSLVMTFFYIASFIHHDNLFTSINSMFFFIGMDFLLLNLFFFIGEFVGVGVRIKKRKIFYFVLGILSIADIVFLILNPFLNNYAIEFVRDVEVGDGIFALGYKMHLFYYYHLVLDYFVIGLIGFHLIWKALSVPREYAKLYINLLIGLAVVVLINAVYLFLPDGPWNYFDYSILLYGFAAVFFYWCAFEYSKKNFLNNFKSSIFETIDQGIVLFDYNNKLLIVNSIAQKLMPEIKFSDEISLEEFINKAGIAGNMNRRDDFYSFQCSFRYKNEMHPVRCDYRKVINKHGQTVGKLFTFADMSAEIDLLTGFQTWDNFKRYASLSNDEFTYPCTIGICDIVALGVYNEVNGKDGGDNLIRELVDLLKDEFSNDTYFVRGREAALIVISSHINKDEMCTAFETIASKFSAKLTYSCLPADDPNKPISEYILHAFSGLSAKRLLDKNSVHSSVISSLVKALQESDSDTEAHVKRTQLVGSDLGHRIGLSDAEISNLSLLCLLHDIGKIGVPLEILNKPGKLTEEEFEIMKSHAEKGYNIALSSEELKGIALFIRHHHERWDGKGYPDGLSRESIPTLSRIIAVVDAFDAMVNDRCYRKALPIEVAKQEILRNAGTQFDPTIASIFLQLLEEKQYYSFRDNEEKIETPIEVVEEDTNLLKEVYVYPIKYSKYYLNSKEQIVQIDDAFTEITGYTMEDIKAKNMIQFDLIPEEERAAYAAMAAEQIGKKQIAYFEHRIVCKNGTTKFVLCVGQRKFDAVTKDMKVEIIICDALKTNTANVLTKELENKNSKRLERWEDVYRKDSLTGLLTHRSFQNDIEVLLLKDIKITLFMIDVDYFKEYNDTYGHREGDEFLISFSQGLLATVGKNNLACRMGGDEFAVAIIGDIDVNSMANKIYSRLEFICQSNKHPVSCSVGISQSSKEINTFNLLYECADKALYHSKEKGRSKYSIYED